MRPYVEELSADRAGLHSAAIPTPACRTSSAATTRRRSRWPACCGEFVAAGWLNIVGGCCGTTPEHIRAIAEAVARPATAPPAGRRAAHAAQRPGAADAPPGQQLHDDRRADQRHRLAEVRPADPGGAVTKRRSRSPASRSRAGPTSSTSTWTKTCSTAKRR